MKFFIVVTDVVNDVTYSRKSVSTRGVITLLHNVIHWKTAVPYDKQCIGQSLYLEIINGKLS